MNLPFYDIEPLEVAGVGLVDIERVYCFDWDAFGRSDMDRLRSIFERLPQSKRHDSDGCHWWFADREDIDSGYLTAAVEPPGLHVFGTLRPKDFAAWDSWLQREAAGLPVRSID